MKQTFHYPPLTAFSLKYVINLPQTILPRMFAATNWQKSRARRKKDGPGVPSGNQQVSFICILHSWKGSYKCIKVQAPLHMAVKQASFCLVFICLLSVSVHRRQSSLWATTKANSSLVPCSLDQGPKEKGRRKGEQTEKRGGERNKGGSLHSQPDARSP